VKFRLTGVIVIQTPLTCRSGGTRDSLIPVCELAFRRHFCEQSCMAGSISDPRLTMRRWLFRGAAVLLGLSLFAVAESVCWFCDIGQPVLREDPFVGFSEFQPLFQPDKSGEVREIQPAQLRFFAAESFAAVKPAGTFRIFCLGGSTVQGRPFSKETSFTTFLELGLQTASPERDWEVVNCGGISYASYRLVSVLSECLQYEPDLVLLCTGHNEFLEDRSYGHIRDLAPVASGPMKTLSRFRSVHLYRQLLSSLSEPPGPETLLGSEVDARLDYQNGLESYVRDEPWRQGVMRHFEFNINRLLQTAAHSRIPVLLILPPSNLADTPPFKSLPGPDSGTAELQQHRRLLETARRLRTTDPYGAVAALEDSIRIDSRQADVHYQLGRLLESLGETDRARNSFVLARDHDICPLRILSTMETAVKSAARNRGVKLVDVHALLEARTDTGILDNEWLLDHVHPSIDGHEQIALALIEAMAAEQMVRPAVDWRSRLTEVYRQYRRTLPEIYYLKGEQRLENLRYWTQGRAEGKSRQSFRD